MCMFCTVLKLGVVFVQKFAIVTFRVIKMASLALDAVPLSNSATSE